jgi:uncharacterized repeat protein (TIGR02543 family)
MNKKHGLFLGFAILLLAAMLTLASCGDKDLGDPSSPGGGGNGEGTTYTVSYDANDGIGTVPASQTANAGSSVTVAEKGDLTYSGYTFAGWNTNASGSGTSYDAGSSLMVNADTTLYAQWTQAVELEAADIQVTFGGLPQDETINLTGPADTLSWLDKDTLTVSVSNTFSGYTWYVDGALLSEQTGNSVTLNAQDYALGGHTVSVRVNTAGGGSYSKTVRFTIAQ